MKAAKIKSVMPGVTVRVGKRGRSVRFACMVNGVRHTRTCEMPVDLLIAPNGTPTRELKSEYGRWVNECTIKSGKAGRVGLRVPTIKELIDAYREIAWKRQADPRFKKADRTIETAIKNFSYCLHASGLRDTRPYTDLVNYDMVRRIADYFVRSKDDGGSGLSALSAWTYISSLQSVTAKWTLVEYRYKGFLVESQTLPKQSLFGISADPKQYEELPRKVVGQIWEWYQELGSGGVESGGVVERSQAFYATCMLELAMRPKDIGELTAENFPLAANGHHRLVYRPTKTRESSNRRVDIEIPDALYEKLRALKPEEFGCGSGTDGGSPLLGHPLRGQPAAGGYGGPGPRPKDGALLVPHLRGTEDAVNESLRAAVPWLNGKQKASYELRKLCIHTILVTPVEQGGGVDQAVRLSGDRRDTIEKYYCDPYKSHVALPEAPLKAFLGK